MPRNFLASLLGVAALGSLLGCASSDWPNYRFDAFREGNQRAATPLSDPAQVPNLAVRWSFPANTAGEGGNFRGGPIVVNGRVFIGSTSGRFYALDANSGALLWQYPAAGQPALQGSCGPAGGVQSYGGYGVMSGAATYFGSVIFGAPDPTAEGGFGSARLFQLDQATGNLIWKSDVVAHVNGCTGSSTSQLHERIGYSAPLVVGRTVYVGVHDAGDDPIQNGMIRSVSADTGTLTPGFGFEATPTRGGGVWNGPATDLSDVYFTTGNTRNWTGGSQPQPNPNYGLSLMRINGNTGAVAWQFQAVPYDLDDDPDWAAGATLHLASCDEMVSSVEKDGWAYAIDATTGNCRWQFPQTEATCKFPSGGAHDHGDTDYKRPAATWGDVLILVTGGEALVHDGVNAGYGRLHALDACAPAGTNRVRWLSDIPHSSGGGYALGSPSVTGGIVYIGTDQGHLVALADPTIAAATGTRCSDIDFATAAACTAAGYAVVPIPAVLADVALPDGSSAAGLRNEPAIASGKLFIGTDGGHVYMLSP
jgi:outer membrane protein assembly factor BamB